MKLRRMTVAWHVYPRSLYPGASPESIVKEKNIYVIVFKGNPRDCAIAKARFVYGINAHTAWYNPIDWKAWWQRKRIFL